MPIDTVKTDVGQFLWERLVPAEVPKEKYGTYARYSANWTYLAVKFAQGVTLEELGIMLRIELDRKRRDFIIGRLVSRMGMMLRDELWNTVMSQIEDSEPSK